MCADDSQRSDESQRSSDVFRRLVDALDKAGIAFKHTTHRAVYTSAEAAEVRGVSLHSGAKALILKERHGFVMVVLPADLALDSSGVRRLLESKRLRFATSQEVLELTSLTPGSIPPFGSLFGLRTICDERMADNERINFNAGSHTESVQMSYADYVAFENPQIALVAKSGADSEPP